jgi:Raf kinase inhibitor-like YbhB/YbcL family protein
MRLPRFVLGLLILTGGLLRAEQNPPPAGQQPPAAPAQPPGGRGGGRGRGGVQIMTLTVPWTDGGSIPVKYTQAGGEISPALSWTNAPETAASFVLIVHDADSATGGGTDDLLHWMVWRIPGTAHELREAVPQGPQLPDGARQISGTGPYYRGPAAPATGPAHHFVFELYALDAMIDVPAVGASPAETRAAVVAAMATHVRGKGVAVGMFKRQPATP